MKFLLRFLRFLFCASFTSAILGCGAIFLVFQFFSDDLPDHTFLQQYFPDVSSRVFLQDGTKLCEYSHERRYFIPIDQIPENLKNAFIAAEDKHFYDHVGIDVSGIGRSIVTNIENIGTGRRPQGASTITQQVARILLMRTNEVSYVRKVKEAILSMRMEGSLSKPKILELYLNQIYLGLGTYGVAAAAKQYFNKTVSELTTAECAYLAALAKGANNYHPVRNKNKAIVRRNWVLDRMLEDRHITNAETKKAKNEDIVVVTHMHVKNHAEYMSEEIRKNLLSKFPIDSLNKNGLIIRATLDPKLQRIAYNALRAGLEEVDRRFGWSGSIGRISISKDKQQMLNDLQSMKKPVGAEDLKKAVLTSIDIENNKISIFTEEGECGWLRSKDLEWISSIIRVGMVILIKPDDNHSEPESVFKLAQLPKVQGAIVVIDVNSGRILAMQGGYSFYQSEFNRATQAMRQCGSVFKPFAYLTALENGFVPNAIVNSSAVEIDVGANLEIWKPKNYNDAQVDKITFRQALDYSINTATVRIAQEVGIEKISKIAENFGIFDRMPRYLSYVLGAGETTLLKITTAYAMLANGGKRIFPTMVDYVLDKYGNVLYRNDTRTVDNTVNYDAEFPPKLNDERMQIADERSVYQITSILEGTLRRREGFTKRFAKCSIAGKTGTSNDSRDTWFIGYTPDIAVGVFVGFDDQSRSLGKKATGFNTAFPIFNNFMLEAKKFLTPKPFKIPQGIKLRKINPETGENTTSDSESSIIEVFKEEDENIGYIMEGKKRRSISALIMEDGKNDEDAANAGKNNNESSKIKPILGVY